MAKRRENESLELIIKRKTTRATIICALIILIAFGFLFVNTVLKISSILAVVITSLIIVLMLCGCIYFLYTILKKAYENQETYKANEKEVMHKLSKSEYTKVIPKYNTKFSEEFLEDLQNKRNVEFYAKLVDLKRETAVKVDIKYVTESSYIEYDAYLPGYFLDYYEIV